MKPCCRLFIHPFATLLLILFSLSEIEGQSKYDIYIFDIKKSVTTRATSIDNKSEYNPSWSPNSKKIAFDVVGAFQEGIYVADVGTGVSQPLTGAEFGNDAAWSPDGEKIAFDVWEDYYHINWWVQNIYTVPASGGTRSLLRLNAQNAGWSPQGNYVVFVDNLSGYIKSMNISTGVETFIAYGILPSWSPNGKYIAYTGYNGGIWTIEVDLSGNPIGYPHMLTNNGYEPTWSQNSKNIVYFYWPTGDPDVFVIPAEGGESVRMCGRVGGFDKGDWNSEYSSNGQYIAWSSYTDPPFIASGISKQKPQLEKIPESGTFKLEQNYPNPFTSGTRLSFRLSKAAHVVLSVYNNLGQKVKLLANADYNSGFYSFDWDGKNVNKKPLSSGLYIGLLQVGNKFQMSKMILSR